jgi:hypothetical protein
VVARLSQFTLTIFVGFWAFHGPVAVDAGNSDFGYLVS